MTGLAAACFVVLGAVACVDVMDDIVAHPASYKAVRVAIREGKCWKGMMVSKKRARIVAWPRALVCDALFRSVVAKARAGRPER